MRCTKSPLVIKRRKRFPGCYIGGAADGGYKRAVLDSVDWASTKDCVGWSYLVMGLGCYKGLRCLMWIVARTGLLQTATSFSLDCRWDCNGRHDSVAVLELSWRLRWYKSIVLQNANCTGIKACVCYLRMWFGPSWHKKVVLEIVDCAGISDFVGLCGLFLGPGWYNGLRRFSLALGLSWYKGLYCSM